MRPTKPGSIRCIRIFDIRHPPLAGASSRERASRSDDSAVSLLFPPTRQTGSSMLSTNDLTSSSSFLSREFKINQTWLTLSPIACRPDRVDPAAGLHRRCRRPGRL